MPQAKRTHAAAARHAAALDAAMSALAALDAARHAAARELVDARKASRASDAAYGDSFLIPAISQADFDYRIGLMHAADAAAERLDMAVKAARALR